MLRLTHILHVGKLRDRHGHYHIFYHIIYRIIYIPKQLNTEHPGVKERMFTAICRSNINGWCTDNSQTNINQ